MAVTVDELAERAGAVIEEVARSGHRTVVTDHGRPVVAIVPISVEAYEPGAILDLIGGYGALADLVPPGRSVVDELLAERREESVRETSA
jgi:prevent-host-death family protein